MTSVPRLSTPPSGQMHPDHQPSQPTSTSQAPGASKKSSWGKGTTNPQHNKRPTHFVCFPLVSDESVSQLSKSLTYFRSITTPLPAPDREVTPERGGGHGIHPDSTAPEQSGREIRGDRDVDRALRIIPEQAHRPPGTFHLTLGVMHLPNAEDLENAAALLQRIDYLELLRRAEAGEGDEAEGSARRRRDKQRPRGGTGKDANELTPNTETHSGVQGKTGEVQPASTGGADRSNDAQHEIRSQPPISEGQADPQELQQTRDPQPVTNTSNHEPEEKENLHQAAKQAGVIPSSHAQALTSLRREISPPPRRVSAPSSTLAQDNSEEPDPPPPVPITISLSSLGTFPSARSARVFYAEPHDPTSRLQRFGNLVRDVFREAGLITETRPLVLHATVANLIYVKSRGKGRGKWKGKGKGRGGGAGDDGNVDAREILRLFNHDGGNHTGAASSPSLPPPPSLCSAVDELNRTTADNPFTWAKDIPIRSIRICKMGAEPSPLPGWGLEYPPVAEKVFLPPAPVGTNLTSG
ncbi:uncharacterized protein Z520_11161 [Fonsecaea multimorphosa CBS 102226]|uniref:A-kinase anchor protein 7-like phosphoesterase domain-containing protein n=1 Tax=Fonsecaea multimorphosa CBS 102226 TaxID=1442371 RepID=A0A0D2JRN3_9EURO|nr:uncharacterized protein Z520_11161 [Fonsecaea multimorphosa CBS 102226]KIX93104.1 hypothetical protein Z520_11161 [Fonsecaea multimorphosa CBS 102226]OAL18402.1 hypothetical protein AYO22_10722 [Fonsecaea multimorphosa]